MSHRDVARTFERGIRRARVPIAYSAGFSPHPRLSWAGAVPTGAASEAEYVELALTAEMDPDLLRTSLDAALPAGLDILECVPADGRSLVGAIDASSWRVRMPGVPVRELSRAVEAFLAEETVEIDRMTKAGHRRIDARQAVVRTVCRAENDTCAILELVARHTTPAVRPDDVLTALNVVAAFRPPAAPEPYRIGQGRLREDGSLTDPLQPERDDAGRLAGLHEA